MNSIESVLNMIATEAAEMAPLESSGSSMSFRFDLELIEDEHGNLAWHEESKPSDG